LGGGGGAGKRPNLLLGVSSHETEREGEGSINQARSARSAVEKTRKTGRGVEELCFPYPRGKKSKKFFELGDRGVPALHDFGGGREKRQKSGYITKLRVSGGEMGQRKEKGPEGIHLSA